MKWFHNRAVDYDIPDSHDSKISASKKSKLTPEEWEWLGLEKKRKELTPNQKKKREKNLYIYIHYIWLREKEGLNDRKARIKLSGEYDREKSTIYKMLKREDPTLHEK